MNDVFVNYFDIATEPTVIEQQNFLNYIVWADLCHFILSTFV